MKKILLALVALLTLTTSAQAMSYEQARERALFLTDKMAYELNLTDDQYEAAYEINLDYLMTVNTYDDLYGDYWRQRNLDLSYILLDWQYRSFCAASYFYRPIYWNAGCWHFGIYARYPHRTYFYFGRPHFYAVYRGGHSWRTNGGRSWYHGRTYGGPRPGSDRRWGMRDGFDRGDYGHGYHGNKPARFGNGSQNQGQAIGNRHFGSGDRGSSTRNNTNNGSTSVNGRPSSNGGFRFGGSSSTTTPNRTFTPTNGNSTNNRVNSSTSSSTPTRTFGGSRSSGSSSFGGSSSSSSNRSFGGSSSSSSNRSFGGSNRSSSSNRSFGGSSSLSSNRSFGGNSSSSSNRSFGGSSSSSSNRSFGGSSSSSSNRSFGGFSRSSSTRSSVGGGASNGGSHFGGRR
jgi:uncharacterized membrane protein YgcG